MRATVLLFCVAACSAPETMSEAAPRDWPTGWVGPLLLWSGSPEDAPECPDGSEPAFEGVADPTATPACPTCACEPARCRMPAGAKANIEKTCVQEPADAEIQTPDGWDGSCVAGAIPEETMRTLRLESTTIGACEPVAVPTEPERNLGSIAIACRGWGTESFRDEGGFRACFARAGDVPCPADYDERSVFYGAIGDSRECTPCGCGEPDGAACTVVGIAFTDQDCSQSSIETLLSLPGYFCAMSSVPWVDIGSITARAIEATPGQCEPVGGEVVGDVALEDPMTFCCAK